MGLGPAQLHFLPCQVYMKEFSIGREKQDFLQALDRHVFQPYLCPAFFNYTILVPSSRTQGEERRAAAAELIAYHV